MKRFVNIHTHFFTGLHTELHASGIHPWDAEKIDISELNEEYFRNAEAIGEIGLDFSTNVNREQQIRLFERQLSMAKKLNLPVVLHCVKAFEQIMKILADYSLCAVIFHGFIGSKQQALQAIEKGYYLSFGHRTAKSPKTIEALRNIPLSQLFAETDEGPHSIENIYEMIASIRGITIEELIEAIEKNYTRIFGNNGK